jgi:hypothetical protein
MWIQEWQINIRPDTHGQTDYGNDGRVWGQYIFLWTSKLPMTALTEMSSSRLWINFTPCKTEKISGDNFRECKV